MKRAIGIAVIALLLVPAFAFAQEKIGEADTSMGMGQQMMMGGGKMIKESQMDRDDCYKKCKMAMMKQKEMVATSDGGVVVLAGGVLLKYDKNLKLVKEAKVGEGSKCLKEMKKQWMEKSPKGKDKMMMQEKAEE